MKDSSSKKKQGELLIRRRMVGLAVAAALFALELFPHVSGFALHEWCGMVTTALLLFHCASSVRFKARKRDLALDIALLVLLAICAFSGSMISGAVLPSLGMYVPGGYFIWTPIHSASAKGLLALLLVHVVAHTKVFSALRSKTESKRWEL